MRALPPPLPGTTRVASRESRVLAVAALTLLALACARIEPPPGGPPDRRPPVLLGTTPDSLAVLPGFDGDVEFLFDEVVSEGSQPSEGLGTGDLERLVVLSPDSQVPRVAWRRSRVTVRPREGWRPNTVYRVELLPGIFDLRQNRSDSGRVITFSTGAPLPDGMIAGRVGDWTTGRAAARAVVEAMLLPDSLRYRTVTDSTGRFRLRPLPAGEYLVYAAVDQNNNRRFDAREGWDSARVRTAAPDSIVLWTFPRDTTGPRIQSVALRDSLTATLTFSQVLDPGQRPDAVTAVRVLALPDSAPVPVATFLFRAAHDSLYGVRDTTREARAKLDTAAARPAPPLVPRREVAPPRPGDRAPPTEAADGFKREPLPRELVLRMAAPLAEKRNFVVIVSGIRNANGVAGDATAGLEVPERPKPVADTLKPLPRDTAPGAGRDTVPPARPPTLPPAPPPGVRP